MPDPRNAPPTMETYTRKTKPRLASTNLPSHNITAAPRALVRPVSAAAVSVPARHAAASPSPSPTATELPNVPTLARSASRHDPDPASPATLPPKPRKRFRKKVNGLFGDHTDLKKRMSRLLRSADPGTLLSTRFQRVDIGGPDGAVAPLLLPSPSSELPPARAVVDQLNASAMCKSPATRHLTSVLPMLNAVPQTVTITAEAEKETHCALLPSDEEIDDDKESLLSFDSPAFVATASRALGSPERLRAVRRNMGRLSPRSNALFLEEILMGGKRDSRRTSTAIEEGTIKPPHIPNVGTFEFEPVTYDADGDPFALSPVSVERTGAPAVLRRKVRRHDRGYRSEDVLRARLSGMPVSEFAASPTVQRRADRVSKWSRTKVRRLDLGCEIEPNPVRDRSRYKRRTSEERRRMEDSQLDMEEGEDEEEEDGEKEEEEEGREDGFDGMESSEGAPPKKNHRLRSRVKRSLEHRIVDGGDRNSRAFALLVEAAAVQQKQSAARSMARSGECMGEGSGSRGPPDERPRKKKRNSSHGILTSLN